MNDRLSSDAELLVELHKDLLKNTIALPIEACKSMATGCATVASLYGAVLALHNSQPALSAYELKTYIILAPFVIFAISGFLFGKTYLPHPRLEELISEQPMVKVNPLTRLREREEQLRRGIVVASWPFWIGLVWAVGVVAFRNVT